MTEKPTIVGVGVSKNFEEEIGAIKRMFGGEGEYGDEWLVEGLERYAIRTDDFQSFDPMHQSMQEHFDKYGPALVALLAQNIRETASQWRADRIKALKRTQLFMSDARITEALGGKTLKEFLKDYTV